MDYQAVHLGLFLVEIGLIVFLTSSSLGGLSRSVFVSTCGRGAIVSTLIYADMLRRVLKCSAHLFRIAGFSVISVVPSTLSNGDVLDDYGPKTAFIEAL